MKILLLVSDFIIPVIVLLIVVFGCLKRVNLYEAFSDGAKEGLKTVVEILPTLIGLLVAVEVVRAGGLLEWLTNLLKPLEVFYTMSLYFMSIKVTKTRHTLFCALMANIAGVFMALILVERIFGR